MSRLLSAMRVATYFGLGVRESMALAVIHLYVEVGVRTVAETMGITEDNARTIISHVNRKGLLTQGRMIPPVKVAGHRQGKPVKTWRLTQKVRTKIDFYETTGKPP